MTRILKFFALLQCLVVMSNASTTSDYEYVASINETDEWPPQNPWEILCQSTDYDEFRNCRWIVNVSAAVPRALALPIYGYIVPFVVVVTMVTNTFIVIVLSRDKLETPTNTILLAMAISEMLTGIFSSPWLLYYYTFAGYKTDDDTGLPPFWCKSLSLFSELLPTVTHDGAIWLTVFLAVQRYICVCVPTIGRRFCTMWNTRIMVILLSLSPLICEIPKALSSHKETHLTFRTVSQNASHSLQQPYRFCVFSFSDWVHSTVGVNNFFTTYFFTVVIAVHALPCLCLVLFTGLLIRTIHKADERRRKSLGVGRGKNRTSRGLNGIQSKPVSSLATPPIADEASVCLLGAHQSVQAKRSLQPKSNGFHATTKMLVAVISVFLAIEIPAAVIFSMYVYVNVARTDADPAEQARTIDRINVCLVVRNMLILVSYPFNFAIYCGMSQQFRTTVRQLLTRREKGRDTMPMGRSSHDIVGHEMAQSTKPIVKSVDDETLEVKSFSNGVSESKARPPIVVVNCTVEHGSAL